MLTNCVPACAACKAARECHMPYVEPKPRPKPRRPRGYIPPTVNEPVAFTLPAEWDNRSLAQLECGHLTGIQFQKDIAMYHPPSRPKDRAWCGVCNKWVKPSNEPWPPELPDKPPF